MTALEAVGFLVVVFLYALLVDIRDQRRIQAATDAAFAVSVANGGLSRDQLRAYDEAEELAARRGDTGTGLVGWSDDPAEWVDDLTAHYAGPSPIVGAADECARKLAVQRFLEETEGIR